MAFSLKLKKRSGFLPLFLIRVFSLQVDLSQLILIKKQGSTHGNFIKILKFFGGFLPFFQISGVSDWALDQSHQESGKIYPIFMYTKWLQSITVIISEELCFVSHQYWSYHIVSLLPDHYRKLWKVRWSKQVLWLLSVVLCKASNVQELRLNCLFSWRKIRKRRDR